MKVYMVYIKGDKSPYAYTIDKEYINLFLEQRNKDMIYIKLIDMNKYEFMIFSNKNRRTFSSAAVCFSEYKFVGFSGFGVKGQYSVFCRMVFAVNHDALKTFCLNFTDSSEI